MTPTGAGQNAGTLTSLATADDFSPTAVEETDGRLPLLLLRPPPIAIDAGRRSRSPRYYRVSRVDVDDEDWARRSQENLAPITVGRITVAPPCADPLPGQAAAPCPAALPPS